MSFIREAVETISDYESDLVTYLNKHPDDESAAYELKVLQDVLAKLLLS